MDDWLIFAFGIVTGLWADTLVWRVLMERTLKHWNESSVAWQGLMRQAIDLLKAGDAPPLQKEKPQTSLSETQL